MVGRPSAIDLVTIIFFITVALANTNICLWSTGRRLDQPVSLLVDDLMAKANRSSYRALKEIDEIQPLIRNVLKVKCSPTASRESREPVEREIRSR